MIATTHCIPSEYQQTEVGVIPDHWEVDAIINRCEYADYRGKTPPKTQSGTFLITARNVRKGYIDYEESQEFVPTELYDQIMARGKPRIGDVLITTEAPLGNVAQVDREDVALAQRIIKYRPRTSDLSSDYLKHFLLSYAFQRLLTCSSSGTTAPGIKGRVLHQLPIAIPPLTEQEVISEALGDADALIESLEQLVAKKRHLKQAAMQQLLTGKKRLPGFEGEWETRAIGDLFNISGGLAASRDQLSHEGHCYLHYGDIHGSMKNFIDVEREYQAIPKLDVPLNKVSPSSLLSDGYVVFVDASEDVDGTNKHVVIANPQNTPFISGLHTIVAKPKTDDLKPHYCRYCFETDDVKRQFRFFAVGTKVSGVSKTNIAKIEVAVPSSTEQLAIADILIYMDDEIEAIEAKLTKARQIKQGMMSNLLTGKIRLVNWTNGE